INKVSNLNHSIYKIRIMRHHYNNLIKALLVVVLAMPVAMFGQEKISYQRPSYWRPDDKTGVNIFETSKKEYPEKFDGLRIRVGAGFTQQFQNLKHENP